MEPLSASPSPRRRFLQRFAAGAAAGAAVVAAGGWPAARAEAAVRPAPRRPAARASDEWVDLLHGDHRQVFDCVEPSNGAGALFALNYIDTYKEAHDITDDDISAVIVYRHFAMPLLLNDAIWAKYPIGQMLSINDPTTNAPATRNVFRDAILLHPGVTYEQMMADQGVIMVACNLALTFASGKTGEMIGVPADEARQEWIDGMLPGAFVAPSGVYAVNLAQEHGCTYCYGG